MPRSVFLMTPKGEFNGAKISSKSNQNENLNVEDYERNHNCLLNDQYDDTDRDYHLDIFHSDSKYFET